MASSETCGQAVLGQNMANRSVESALGMSARTQAFVLALTLLVAVPESVRCRCRGKKRKHAVQRERNRLSLGR